MVSSRRSGWLVLLGCFLVQLASSPGHTFGVNAFVDSWVDDLSLSRTRVSSVWLVASLCSAAAVPFAGMALDRFGARRLVAVAGPALILTIVQLSRARTAYHLAAGVALTRFLGPECMVLTAQTTTQRWFVRRRGLAMSILSLSFLILQSQPPAFSMLIAHVGWRRAYLCIASVMTALLLLGMVLLPDLPLSFLCTCMGMGMVHVSCGTYIHMRMYMRRCCFAIRQQVLGCFRTAMSCQRVAHHLPSSCWNAASRPRIMTGCMRVRPCS